MGGYLKRSVSLFSVMAIAACLAGMIFAADYYVSPSGSDSNSGTSELSPWATFSHAWGILQSGDNLILLDGTYYQGIVPTINGFAGNPITIKAKMTVRQ